MLDVLLHGWVWLTATLLLLAALGAAGSYWSRLQHTSAVQVALTAWMVAGAILSGETARRSALR